MFAGYQRAPADVVIFLVFLAPIGIAVLAPRALGEHASRATLAALAIAVAGFALITGPDLSGGSSGSTVAGIAAATLSGATLVVLILVSKPLAEAYGGMRLTWIELTAPASSCSRCCSRRTGRSPTGATWSPSSSSASSQTAACTSIYLEALAHVPATHVGILGYLEPVSFVVLSWLVLDQSPTVATLAGGALIVAAGALVIRSASPSVPTTPEVPARVAG